MDFILNRIRRAYEIGQEINTNDESDPLAHRLFYDYHEYYSHFADNIESVDDIIKLVKEYNYKNTGNILPGPNGSIYISFQIDEVVGTEILAYPIPDQKYEIVRYKNQLVAVGNEADVKNAGLSHAVTFVLTRKYSTTYNAEWFVLSDVFPGYAPCWADYSSLEIGKACTGKELIDRHIHRITFI